jgi:endonuclease III related protein
MKRDSKETENALQEVYQRLYQHYGPQGWWPGEGLMEVVLGAILTQAAAWRNVELALKNLKEAGFWTLEAIRDCPQEVLAEIIRPCGYYISKARKLKAFAEYVYQYYEGSLGSFLSRETSQLRAELLSIYGIGPETADDIIVYAAEKPSFVIDAYTRRILHRMGLWPGGLGGRYEDWQRLFHENLPKDVALFNEYHALLDRHAKDTCAKRPKCAACCLRDICATSVGTNEATLVGLKK